MCMMQHILILHHLGVEMSYQLISIHTTEIATTIIIVFAVSNETVAMTAAEAVSQPYQTKMQKNKDKWMEYCLGKLHISSTKVQIR
mmetsp:Transcript_13239/g.17750  ORF Transcript_13239/g.17750 Transcript_13239/m.17750 type:complete len:86 (-) Transcript_13239:25-282(-)